MKTKRKTPSLFIGEKLDEWRSELKWHAHRSTVVPCSSLLPLTEFEHTLLRSNYKTNFRAKCLLGVSL